MAQDQDVRHYRKSSKTDSSGCFGIRSSFWLFLCEKYEDLLRTANPVDQRHLRVV